MKKLIATLFACALLACAPGILPLQPNLNFNVDVPPLPAAFVDLDGQWVLTAADGNRACLVIQESRVSILDLTCSTDGRGFVARITKSPVISRAGSQITLSVTFNPQSLDLTEARLTFVGTLQVDATFIGTLRDETLGSKDFPGVIGAVLSRQ